MSRLIATLAITATCTFLATSAEAGGCHRSSPSYGHSHYEPSHSYHSEPYHSHHSESVHEHSEPYYIVVEGQLFVVVDGRLFPVPSQGQPMGGPSLPGQQIEAPFPSQPFAGPSVTDQTFSGPTGQPFNGPSAGQPFSDPTGPGQTFSAPAPSGQQFNGPTSSGQPFSGPMATGPTAQGQSFAGPSIPGQPVSDQQFTDQPGVGPTAGQPVVDPSLRGVPGQSFPSDPSLPVSGTDPIAVAAGPVADAALAAPPVAEGPVLPPTVETSLTAPVETMTPVVTEVPRSEVYTGMPLQLSAPGCTDLTGFAVLRFPGFEMPLTINVWREGLIEVQMPTLSVSGNMEATLLIHNADRTLFAELPLMLINAAQ